MGIIFIYNRIKIYLHLFVLIVNRLHEYVLRFSFGNEIFLRNNARIKV